MAAVPEPSVHQGQGGESDEDSVWTLHGSDEESASSCSSSSEGEAVSECAETSSIGTLLDALGARTRSVREDNTKTFLAHKRKAAVQLVSSPSVSTAGKRRRVIQPTLLENVEMLRAQFPKETSAMNDTTVCEWQGRLKSMLSTMVEYVFTMAENAQWMSIKCAFVYQAMDAVPEYLGLQALPFSIRTSVLDCGMTLSELHENVGGLLDDKHGMVLEGEEPTGPSDYAGQFLARCRDEEVDTAGVDANWYTARLEEWLAADSAVNADRAQCIAQGRPYRSTLPTLSRDGEGQFERMLARTMAAKRCDITWSRDAMDVLWRWFSVNTEQMLASEAQECRAEAVSQGTAGAVAATRTPASGKAGGLRGLPNPPVSTPATDQAKPRRPTQDHVNESFPSKHGADGVAQSEENSGGTFAQ